MNCAAVENAVIPNFINSTSQRNKMAGQVAHKTLGVKKRTGADQEIVQCIPICKMSTFPFLFCTDQT